MDLSGLLTRRSLYNSSLFHNNQVKHHLRTIVVDIRDVNTTFLLSFVNRNIILFQVLTSRCIICVRMCSFLLPPPNAQLFSTIKMRLRDLWDIDDFIFCPMRIALHFFSLSLYTTALSQWNIHPCPHASIDAKDRQPLAHRDHHHNHHQPFT